MGPGWGAEIGKVVVNRAGKFVTFIFGVIAVLFSCLVGLVLWSVLR